jgi:hypothetical protein
MGDGAERVVTLLRRFRGERLCAACLALQLHVSLQEVRESLDELRRRPDVETRDTICSICARTTLTLGAR